MKDKTKKEKTLNIKLKTTFELVHYDNVQRLVVALSMSGYFVNVSKSSEVFIIRVYQLDNYER